MPSRAERREALNKVIYGLVVAGFCIGLQYVVGLLPGVDIVIGKGPIGLWLRTALAVVILVVMLRLLPALRVVTTYYIGLIFRVSSVMEKDVDLQGHVSLAGLYFLLILYLGFIYGSVLPPVLQSLVILLGLTGGVIKLFRLAFAVAGIFLVIRLAVMLKPLAERLTRRITDQTVELTEKVDSKPCPNCGGRIERAAKFCPLCGKQA